MKIHAALAIVLLTASLARADSTSTRPLIGIGERLGEHIALNATFTDEQGQPVVLRDLVTKPTILTFVYYKCPGICTPLLTDLSKVLDKIDLEPGKDFRVVTISFDASETFDVAADKRGNYLGAMKRKIDPSAWRFLTGDSATIRRVTESAGFYFARQNDEWIHAGALIVLAPDGKVTRYIPGTQFLPFDVKMAVYEASDGKVSPTLARVMKFCFSYDPEGRTYALNVTRIAMVATLGFVALFAAVFLIRPRKRVQHS
jgi:protein SCO1/2